MIGMVPRGLWVWESICMNGHWWDIRIVQRIKLTVAKTSIKIFNENQVTHKRGFMHET